MNFFDSLYEDTLDCLKGKDVASFDLCTPWEDVGKNQIVFANDTAFELEGVGFNLVTSNELGKSEIRVVGKNLDKIGKSTKFARISIIQLEDEEDEQKAYDIIRKVEYAKYHYFPKGYMARMSSGTHSENVRISKEAIKKGISFERVGSLLASKYLENKSVKNVIVYFITDELVDFGRLQKISEKNYEITETLNHIMNDINFDCNVCKLKPICDEVEGMKELHQKTSKM